jgi:hypothetical protein
MQDYLIGFFAIVVTVITSAFLIRKLYGWLRPIRVSPSVTIRNRDRGPDQLGAEIVNRSREPLYIVQCKAIGAHPLRQALKTHIKRPLTRPRLIRAIYFGVNAYDLMNGDRTKLDPDEPLSLSRDMTFPNPMFLVHTPMLVIEVVLSSGRKVRSQRFEIPRSWTLVNHLETQSAETKNA